MEVKGRDRERRGKSDKKRTAREMENENERKRFIVRENENKWERNGIGGGVEVNGRDRGGTRQNGRATS